jgi:NADH dehydrogenase (ubiquinone) Fe-S protein 3
MWDMFGVFSLTTLIYIVYLTNYSFEGHPLQKDFPLNKYVEVHYDDSKKCMVSKPIEMTQEFCYFDFISPWEQMSCSDKSNKKVSKICLQSS